MSSYISALTGYKTPSLQEKKYQEPSVEEINDKLEKTHITDSQKARVKLIENVHEDDIHALIKISHDRFASGSKDGSLKVWDSQGNLNKCVWKARRIEGRVNYHQWITALAPLGKDSWMSGSRNNYLSIWNKDDKKEVCFQPKFVDHGHLSKRRNQDRINCLTDLSSLYSSPTFAIGRATQLTWHQLNEDGWVDHIDEVKVDKNDWVYAIHPLHINKLLVVTGTRLDLLHRSSENKKWSTHLLIEEFNHYADLKEKRDRSFISSLTPLIGDDRKVALSIFNGSMQVFDVVSQKISFEAREHENRVWTVVNTQKNSLASCADDGLIKIWDIRASSQALFTLRDNPETKARTSVLLPLDDHILLSGSCPDAVHQAQNKAQFSFWDMRKLF
ncbi:MAG: hypothetical protein ACOVOR_03555 [Rhabdochlamydiaceae bacterium]